MVKKKHPFWDKLYIGLIVGLIVPILIFYLYYLAKYSEVEFGKYFNSLLEYRLLFKIMSLCALSDLPVFFLFIQFKLFKGARGVVMACFIYAFSVLAYRIVS